MLKYAIRRFLTVIPVLLGVSLLVFSFIHLIPGDPAVTMLGERATPGRGAGVRGPPARRARDAGARRRDPRPARSRPVAHLPIPRLSRPLASGRPRPLDPERGARREGNPPAIPRDGGAGHLGHGDRAPPRRPGGGRLRRAGHVPPL